MIAIHWARGLPISRGRLAFSPTRRAASAMPTSRKTTSADAGSSPATSCSVRRVEHGATTEGEHRRPVGQGRDLGGHGLALERTEGGLAVLDEHVGDGLAGRLLDPGVGVAERQPASGGDEPSDGGLARTHRTDEHDGVLRQFLWHSAHRMVSGIDAR